MTVTEPPVDTVNYRTFNTGSVQLNVAEVGAGEPIVLLHGWGSTHLMWRKLWEPLARHYRVVAPDLRGFGDSDIPDSGYDKLTVAGDIAALIADLDDRPAHVVGHDYGGPVAYLLSSTRPDLVRSLTLIETMLPGLDFPVELGFDGMLWHPGFHATPGLPEALISGRERLYLDYFYDTFAVDPASIEDDVRERYAAAYARPGALAASFAYYRTPEDIAAIQSAARRLIDVPVLAIGGSGSLAGTTVNCAKAIGSDVTGAVIDGAGHWVPEERPDEVLALLTRFLARQATR